MLKLSDDLSLQFTHLIERKNFSDRLNVNETQQFHSVSECWVSL